MNDNISLASKDSGFDSTGSDFYDNGSVSSDGSADSNEGGGRNEVLEMSSDEKDDTKQLFSFEASYLDDNEGAIFSISDQERL